MNKDKSKSNYGKQETSQADELREVKKDTVGEKNQIKETKEPRPDEKVSILASEWEELNKKAQLSNEYYDKLLRLGAEFDNVRKRIAKEKEDLIRFATKGLILEILPIVDDFDHLIEGIKNNRINGAVLEGIKMIQKRIRGLLEENGLVRMKAVGEKFDPHKHEALMTLETDEYPENTIIEEVRSGYLLYDRILRPAVVKVSKLKKPGE